MFNFSILFWLLAFPSEFYLQFANFCKKKKKKNQACWDFDRDSVESVNQR